MLYMVFSCLKENITPNHVVCGCNFYEDYKSAKNAFDFLDHSSLCCATLSDFEKCKTLIDKYIEKNGVVHISERTV